MDAGWQVKSKAVAVQNEIDHLERRIKELRGDFLDSLKDDWSEEELKQAGF
jgi:hypothetical protein